jgi:DNA-directed RNA polymerase
MVHDSYAVHACDVPVMDRVLREEFVRLHGELTLRSLWDEFKRQAPHFCVVPPPPAVGTLDLAGVLKSEYFFS